MRGSTAALACVVGMLLGGAEPSAGSEPAPFALHLDVRYADGVGRRSLRDEIVLELRRALADAECFADVSPDPPADPSDQDLVLEVVLLQVVDETVFEVTLAQRESEEVAIGQERRKTAVLFLDVLLQLKTAAEGIVLRDKHPRVRKRYRPLFDEDPRVQAEIAAIDGLTRIARSFSCKGAGAKLGREVERARRKAAGD